MDSTRTTRPATAFPFCEDADSAFFGASRRRADIEAMEEMASRMAHDVNNALTSITGLGSLIMDDLDSGRVRSADVRGIMEAANRARLLTSDLLAFSRRASRDCRTRSGKPLDLQAFLDARHETWQSRLGDAITLEMHPCGSPLVVRGSEPDLEAIFDRILENVPDFLSDGGTLRINVSRRALGTAFCGERGLVEGDFAAVRISDDGPGMNATTAARVFDPFFTTRPHRGAHGLGLSVAHGLARDAGGHIELTTRPAQGCTFTIFLPLSDTRPVTTQEVTQVPSADLFLENFARPAPTAFQTPEFPGFTTSVEAPPVLPPLADAASAPASSVPSLLPVPKASDGLRQGQETVLVVEDEPMVRELVTRSLGYLGYNVIKACNGQEGYDLATTHAHEIDIIFSDIVMPRMGGPEMVQRLRESGLNFRVLFTSGFTENQGILENDELREGVHILPKPYATKDLAERLRTIIDTE